MRAALPLILLPPMLLLLSACAPSGMTPTAGASPGDLVAEGAVPTVSYDDPFYDGGVFDPAPFALDKNRTGVFTGD